MDIKEKFERGSESHTYQRIDIDYKVNIFLGYNEDGKLSMVITEPGKETLVKSTKQIEVKMKRREDGKLALSFDLLDEAYKSIFYVFCNDIINVAEKSGSSMAISGVLTRWKYWKEMFGKRKNEILDKSEIKGLMGELIQIKDYFLVKWDEKTAYESWLGPLYGHKDFELDNTWYEVKAVNENALQVRISSLEQLESDIDGHLMVVRLEETSKVSDRGINLNSLISDMASRINDPDIMDLFLERLDNMGYSYNLDYDDYCFIYKGTEIYKVDNKFPKITRKSVASAIGNASYSVLLNAIIGFKEE